MAVTVKQLAETVGISVEKLLEQLARAGITKSGAEDPLTDEERAKLLAYLRAERGETAPKRVTLKRKERKTLKLGRVPGVGDKTVQVEVRRKRTYVKRPEGPTPEQLREAERARRLLEEQRRLEEEARRRAEEEAKRRAEEEARRRAEEEARRQAEEARRKEEAKRLIEEAKKKAEKEARAKEREEKEKEAEKVALAEEVKPQKAKPKEKSKKAVKPKAEELILIPEAITVGELAKKMAVKASEVIKQLMNLGIMATINQTIDQESAALVAEELGFKPILPSPEEIEAELLAKTTESLSDPKPRPPIVTVMGHVDHGKTTLLDYIRKTRVAAREAGGITQHIGAYQVETDHGKITFIDTPGHAAFTAMRARGARVTDIVILVVAADDGVMPQTKEAIEHARAADVPIIVAINKIDLPSANPERVKQELAALNVVPEEWGGDTQFVEVSAKTGQGIDDLLEAILLLAEVLELKAPTKGSARAIVLESRLEKGRGPVANVVVMASCLKRGDIVLCGETYGRVRAMVNERGQQVKEAGPSTPVEVLGLSRVPQVGDELIAVKDEKIAKQIAEMRAERVKKQKLAQMQAAKLEEVFEKMQEGETAELNLIIKTDVQGTYEALRDALTKLSDDEVRVNVISGGVGAITETDVNLAITAGAIIIGFNVRADATARKLAEERGIQIRYYNVIYDVIDDVKKAIAGLLRPEIKEQIIGLAEVRQVFRHPKFGQVAGCMVLEGVVKRNGLVRVLRDNVVIFEGKLESLKRYKEDVTEVKAGMECGIGIKNYNDIRVGDLIEIFERVEVQPEVV